MSVAASILPLDRVHYAAHGVLLFLELTLRIPKGRRLILFGPNGAGKSLTLRLCHGLIAPISGAARWVAAPARKRHAMIFQRPVLLRRSVRANLTHALSLDSLPRIARAARTTRPYRASSSRCSRAPGAAPLGRRAAAASGGARLCARSGSAVSRRTHAGARPRRYPCDQGYDRKL